MKKLVDGVRYFVDVSFNSSVDYQTTALIEVSDIDITKELVNVPYSICKLAMDLGWKPVSKSIWEIPYQTPEEFNKIVSHYVNHEDCDFELDFNAIAKETKRHIGTPSQVILPNYQELMKTWIQESITYEYDPEAENEFANYVENVATVKHDLDSHESCNKDSLIMVNEVFKSINQFTRIPNMETSIVMRQFVSFEEHIDFIFNKLNGVIEWHMNINQNTNAYVFCLQTGHVICTTHCPMWDGEKWKFDSTATLLFRYGVGSSGNFLKSRGNLINYLDFKMKRIEKELDFL